MKNLMKKVYGYDKSMVISNKEIKELKKFSKKNLSKVNSIEEFLNLDAKIKEIVKKSKAIEFEIKNQISVGKELQAGILAECVYNQTLANILEFNNFINLKANEKNPFELNKNLRQTILTNDVRYIYYKDENNILLQCGSPYTVDTILFFNSEEIRIEIKDIPALIGFFDLVYDEAGQLEISDQIKETYPCYINPIKKINSETNFFNELGRTFSFKLESDVFFEHYFEEKKINFFMVADKNSELIIVDKTNIKEILEISQSKIMLKGKNARVPFTPNKLRAAFKENNIQFNSLTNQCVINKANIKAINKRGGTDLSRIEFSKIFFVKKFTIDGEKIFFDFKNIKQTKSAISATVKLKTTKQKIKNKLI